MTKPIASIAMMMLYEEGHFLFSDPVARFIPAFKEVKVYVEPHFRGIRASALQREITLHDLMTHTSGLTYGLFDESPVERMYQEKKILRPDRTIAEIIEDLVTLPLLHQPGSKWQYSVSTDVLGRVIELVSGMTLDVFLKERIFKPLGMSDTAFYVPEEKKERFAMLYGLNPQGKLTQIKPLLSSFSASQRLFSAGGGLVSTITDYMRFCQMMAGGGELNGSRLVGRKSIELMTLNHLAPALMPIEIGGSKLHGYGFGLGVRVMTDVAATGLLGSIGEYGWGGAASTYFLIDPQEALIAILMTQFMPSDYYPIREQFKTAIYQAIVD
jgi:CubicO group peptidase (beta-lactamase class C family)